VSFVSTIFRNLLGKPVAADFRDSAEHFVSVLREHGIGLSFGRDDLRYVDDLAERLATRWGAGSARSWSATSPANGCPVTRSARR